MPFNKTLSLTDDERLDVRFAMTQAELTTDAKDEKYETEEAYLSRLEESGSEVTNATLKSYHDARDRADAEAFTPFFTKARELSRAGRVALALDIRERCAAEGLDTGDLDAIISAFAAQAAQQAPHPSPTP
jgi:hypothetical protein